MVEAPLHITAELTPTTEEERTVTVEKIKPEPQLFVQVIEYVVVAIGLAVTTAPVMLLKPVAGNQE